MVIRMRQEQLPLEVGIASALYGVLERAGCECGAPR